MVLKNTGWNHTLRIGILALPLKSSETLEMLSSVDNNSFLLIGCL